MLLFDLMACQPIGDTANHGGKEYAEAIFCEIIRKGYAVSGIYDSRVNCNRKFLEYCQFRGELIDVNKCTLQESIDSGKYSSFYSAIPYHYDNIRWGNIKFIGNIHGLRDIEVFTDKYEYFYATTFYQKVTAIAKKNSLVKKYKIAKDKARLWKILNNPSFICLTGTMHSKYSILLNFPELESSNIHVFCDPLIIENVSASSCNTIGKYHLLVSGNRWIKNTLRGILALDELISAGKIETKVVVTGVVGNMPWINRIHNKDSFIFKGYVSSNELACLFKDAYCLVFLSLSEGFGYPPLEAISRNVPVISSPLTAIYEVYQDGALYCDPYSIEDIKTKILELEDIKIREQYIKQGCNRFNEIIKMQNEDLSRLVDFIIK